MNDSGTKFIIFGDVLSGYWWRLRSPKGETLRSSGRTHRHKAECEWEVYRLKEERSIRAGARRDHRVNGM